MIKRIAWIMTLVMLLSVLAGCAGTTVVVGNCTCPTEPAADNTPAAAEGALKTGLAIVAKTSDSTSATAEAEGKAKYDVTIAAVTVDDAGVIRSCIIDSVGTEAAFDATGNITTDLTMYFPQTKNELGEAYGLKASGSKYEWNEQAAAVAAFAVGKTAEEFKNGAVSESGEILDADLASTASIYIGGYVGAIVKAAETAKHLGAQSDDTLKLAVINQLDGKNGESIELNTDVVAMTMNGDTITSCYIDSLQAPVAFDASGKITSDTSAAPQTKNELGEAYNMKAWGNAIAEWDVQTASFCQYVTGKTPEEVAGIAVSEGKASEADLAASVTITIDGFQNLIAKAAK